MIGLWTCGLISWCLIIGGFGLETWMICLREGPSRRGVGTQHLAIVGMAGLACGIAGMVMMFFFCD